MGSKKREGIKLLALACGPEGVISMLSWSPRGTHLACSSFDRTVRIWDFHHFKNPKVIEGHEWNIASVAWAPQSEALATVSDDRRLRLWDFPSTDEMGEIEGHTKGITSVAWSPNGRDIVTTSNDRRIRVWDMQKGKIKTTLDSHEYLPRFVAYSHSGDYLASCSEGGTVRLWKGGAYNEDLVLRGHRDMVNVLAWAPDNTLVSGSDDHTIRVWDVRKGESLELHEHEGPVKALSFSSCGRILASRSWDQTLRLWRCDTWNMIATIEEDSASPFPVLAFHPSEPLLASMGAVDRVARIWQMDLDLLADAEPSRQKYSYRTEEMWQLVDQGYSELAALPPQPPPATEINDTPFASCPQCTEIITQHQADKRRQLGFNSIHCLKCELEVSLGEPAAIEVTGTTVGGGSEKCGLHEWAGGERVTLAILFTDIVDSTLIGQRLGDEGMRDVRRQHFKVAREIIHSYGGYEIKTLGDSFMIAFKDAPSGLNCAIKLHRNTGHDDIKIRAGLHIGPVDIEENDAFGSMVNFTARLIGKADGDEICISDAARDVIRKAGDKKHLNLEWFSYELVSFKGFPGIYRYWTI